jgi:gamma-glutamyltranspeptidase/glutathione hydrolase
VGDIAWPGHSVWAGSDIVAAGHYLVAEAAMAVLEEGGTAADAAVAAAAVAAVTMPDMCGLGGEAFCLWFEPGRAPVAALGSGVLPRAAPVEALRRAGERLLPLYGGASVAVPGAVRLWHDLHAGRGVKSWSRLLEPAIRLARDGFVVDRRLATSLAEHAGRLVAEEAAGARFLSDGRPLREGERLIQPELAEALATLATDGADALYTGPLAAATARAAMRRGGWLATEDLAAHQTEWAEPLALDYRGHTVWQTPPPSQGVVVLEALGILARRWDGEGDWRESDWTVHLLLESLKRAFSDRRRHLGDPRHVAFDARALLEPNFLDQAAAAVGERASPYPWRPVPGDTMSFVIVDRAGRAVSFIQSLALAFGSGVYVPEGGFFLNNRAGRSVDLDPASPNVAVGGKRPMHTLNAWLVTRNGTLWAVGNTFGGDGQPQWNVQALVDLIDGGLLPHEVVARPRVTLAPATDVHALDEPHSVTFEARFPGDVVEGVRRRGHPVRYIGPWEASGSLQVVVRRDGGLAGASDPRAVGMTIGR